METEILVWMILMISEVTETCAMMTLGLIMILVATEILAGLKEETTEVMASKENLTLEGVEVMVDRLKVAVIDHKDLTKIIIIVSNPKTFASKKETKEVSTGVMTTEMTLSIKEDMITRPVKYPLEKTRRSPFQAHPCLCHLLNSTAITG